MAPHPPCMVHFKEDCRPSVLIKLIEMCLIRAFSGLPPFENVPLPKPVFSGWVTEATLVKLLFELLGCPLLVKCLRARRNCIEMYLAIHPVGGW